MHRSRSTTSLLVTLTVGLATLFALALPEGVGGRDSVVRLTRGGLHRIRCADTASHEHGGVDACLEAVSAPLPNPPLVSGSPLFAVVVAHAPALPAPTYTVAPAWRALPSLHIAPPGHATSGRAPPTC